MTNRNYATRLSCFSLISSIETDLRDIICEESLEPAEESLPTDVFTVASARFRDHSKKEFSITEDGFRSLLDFVDFYDLSKILNKISTAQGAFSEEEIRLLTQGLESLTPLRNRVCHSRPLEASDFTELIDFTKDLLSYGQQIAWPSTRVAVKNLDNPAFALTLSIPDFWKSQKRSIFNNLPLPEFDDIGFIGRQKDRKSINTLLASNTRVISIVGEGGIGKTALAQRCLYDILELCEDKVQDAPLYDIVLWVSLKTNRLTSVGIEQIRDAISSGAGLFQNISSSLGASSASDMETVLNEICVYMEEFKILLCIDNLETISSGEVREFLANIPQQSKVLITTRMGLGEIEYRYKLDKLDDKPSAQLMRSLSKLLNIENLYSKKQEDIVAICRGLYNNPLLIKWYVLSIASGRAQGEIINRQGGGFQEALRFCFENLYDCLSEVEVDVIAVIACWRKPVSAVELRFILSDVDEVAVEEALSQLHNSSMLESNTDYSDSRTYALTGVASEFITSLRPASTEIYELVKRKKRELQVILDQQSIMHNNYKYDLNAIYWSNRDENICAIYLKKAQTESRLGRDDRALEHIKTAKAMMPAFSECYRIHAAILRDTPFQAQSELEHAVQLNPKSSLTRYAYAQFCLKEEDYTAAEEQILEALKIDSDDVSLKTCKAWIYLLTGRYSLAATIYEEIIPLQGSRRKKFRLSTYDQAANCYIRLAEQLLRDSDFSEARKSLVRAEQIISEAVSKADYDNFVIQKLFRLLALAEQYYTRSGDASVSVDIVQLIDVNADFFVAESLQVVKKELSKYSAIASPGNEAKVKDILARLNGPDREFGVRISGNVLRVVDSERGVSFGFIKGQNEIEYFFHRGYLRPHNMLDNSHHNTPVTFSPGRSSKGLCAFDIELI
jgi:LuxR family glucitol operon transcriptional activator